jgi:hypothetical protein
MKNYLIVLVSILFVCIASCKHDNDDYYNNQPCYPCGMSSPNPTYVEAKRIIKKYCVTCHNVDSIGRYLQYDQLNAVCIDGEFSKRVFLKRDMPPVGACQMDSCDYVILKRWYINGHNPY